MDNNNEVVVDDSYREFLVVAHRRNDDIHDVFKNLLRDVYVKSSVVFVGGITWNDSHMAAAHKYIFRIYSFSIGVYFISCLLYIFHVY
jgi:hypothetical protein